MTHKIHVPDWKVNIYNQIPELAGYFTSDPLKSRIHSCTFNAYSLPRKKQPCSLVTMEGQQYQVYNIRPSTMWFTAQKKSLMDQENIVATSANPEGINRICYTMHSSYSEIRDLVSFLQPTHVMPTVLPTSDKQWEPVKDRLKSFLLYPNNERSKYCRTTESSQALGTLRKVSSSLVTLHHKPSDLDELVFS
ncbi:Protein artemis [Bulinus truncatus]|nr:Protein artemis [Bulinus truncatus]